MTDCSKFADRQRQSFRLRTMSHLGLGPKGLGSRTISSLRDTLCSPNRKIVPRLCAYVLPTGGPTAQVCRLGPKVGGRLALFCIHHVNRVNSRNDSVTES